jgi:hypothetical protein
MALRESLALTTGRITSVMSSSGSPSSMRKAQTNSSSTDERLIDSRCGVCERRRQRCRVCASG